MTMLPPEPQQSAPAPEAGEPLAPVPDRDAAALAAAPGLRVADGFALTALFVGVFAAVGIPFGVTRWLTGWEPGGFSAVLAAETVAAVATIWMGLRWAGLPFRVACPIRPYPLRIVPALLLASFGATILLGEVVRWIPGSAVFQRALLLEFGQSSPLVIFLAASVGAPVLEELICRGVLLGGLRRRHSVAGALWLSAILFAIIHLNPWQAAGALPLGLAWGWLVLRTGSIVPGVLSHAMVNFSSSFLVAPVLLALGYTPAQLRNSGHFPPLALAIGAAAALVGALGVWWQLRAVPPRPEPALPPPPEPAHPPPPEPVLLPPPEPGSAGQRLVMTVVAALVLVAATPAARLYLSRREGPGDSRAAGCYALDLPARASVRLFPGAPTPAGRVRVRLSRTPYRRAWEDRRKYLVQRLDDVGPTGLAADASPVYWFAAARGNLRIVAQQGSALTLLRLRQRGDQLAGVARHYSGVEGEAVDEAGPVSGRRIGCPAASPQGH